MTQHQEPCSCSGCGRTSATVLDIRPLCREHFITSCYGNLDEYSRLLDESRYRDTTTELVRRFLTDCTRRAVDLAQATRDLDNLERARILDILLRATDLCRQLRRSPRKIANIPIKLSSDKLGQSWEEYAVTSMVSRHGASVECSHPVETGDQVLVDRQDRAGQVRARVAWRQAKAGDRWEIGLEFVSTENFWDVDWTANDPNYWPEPEKPKTPKVAA